MCDHCGCNPTGGYRIISPDGSEDLASHHGLHDNMHHHHDHPLQEHIHTHSHDERPLRQITIEQDAMHQNQLMAERNKGWFEAKKITTINFVSSPGAGKTSLLERTITNLIPMHRIYVIEGDQHTTLDAERIRRAGAEVVQINTGSGCHLDATMINKTLDKMHLEDRSFLFIENVGNLVCPALFQLGEKKRVLLVSITEGEDKPLKYPYMFRSSDLCIINKCDLLPYLSFNMDLFRNNTLKVNQRLTMIETSVTTGENFVAWTNWIKEQATE